MISHWRQPMLDAADGLSEKGLEAVSDTYRMRAAQLLRDNGRPADAAELIEAVAWTQIDRRSSIASIAGGVHSPGGGLCGEAARHAAQAGHPR